MVSVRLAAACGITVRPSESRAAAPAPPLSAPTRPILRCSVDGRRTTKGSRSKLMEVGKFLIAANLGPPLLAAPNGDAEAPKPPVPNPPGLTGANGFALGNAGTGVPNGLAVAGVPNGLAGALIPGATDGALADTSSAPL